MRGWPGSGGKAGVWGRAQGSQHRGRVHKEGEEGGCKGSGFWMEEAGLQEQVMMSFVRQRTPGGQPEVMTFPECTQAGKKRWERVDEIK